MQAIVYADLVGLNEEDARARLLAAVSDDRPKPASVPFPDSPAKPFPGSAPKAAHPPASEVAPHAVPEARRRDSSGQLWSYAALSTGSFLLGVGLLFLMMWKVETLAAFGLTGKLFYLVLIPMGIAAAGFLFGVLRSVSVYRGRSFGGTVEMGGPILAAALVVWGGFALPPPERASFAMTIFVHGPGGPQDSVLRSQGKVVMDLKGNRRFESIDEKGAAHFPGIPAEFLAQPVPISLDAEGFELADPGLRKLVGESLYLTARKRVGRLYGMVTGERGAPLAGAFVGTGEFMTQTDTMGRFEVTIPGDKVRGEMTLDVRASGFQPQTLAVTPGANEIRISLRRLAP